MVAGKALALSAVVLATAAHAAMAGAIGQSDLSWVSWTPHGVVQTPSATTASLFGLGTSAGASTVPDNSPSPAAISYATATAAAASPAPAPAATYAAASQAPAATTAPAGGIYDAYINLGSGPYADAGNLTTGGAQPWVNSPGVAALFGGTPTPQQQSQFAQAVLSDVQQTFALSGVPVSLTTDPHAAAAHTLSVVSNTTSTWGPVLGLTNIGSNGFDFIDQAAKVAQNVNQLEWVVAHNVSHELMLAFGVPENYDQSGSFVDARSASLGMMLNPNATFSQSASQALLAQDLLASNEPIRQGAQLIGAQYVDPQPVPEPTTIAAWSLAVGGVVLVRSRRARVAA